eukprot:4356729-Pleurochrysis_carterae.AAC.2
MHATQRVTGPLGAALGTAAATGGKTWLRDEGGSTVYVASQDEKTDSACSVDSTTTRLCDVIT